MATRSPEVRRGAWPWLTGSLLVHAAIVFAIGLLDDGAPVEREPPDRVQLSGERLAELASALRERRAEALAEQLARLRELEAKLRELLDDDAADAQADLVMQTADPVAAILAAQARALRLLEAGRGAAATGDRSAAAGALGEALGAMGDALDRLASIDPDGRVTGLQAAALNAHAHARIALGAWAEASGQLAEQRSRSRDARRRELEIARDQRRAARERLAAAEEGDRPAAVERARADLAAAESRISERRDEPPPPEPPDDEQLRELAERAVGETVTAQALARRAVLDRADALRASAESGAGEGADLGVPAADRAGRAPVSALYAEAVASERRIGAVATRLLADAAGGDGDDGDDGDEGPAAARAEELAALLDQPIIDRPAFDAEVLDGAVGDAAAFERLATELDRAVRTGRVMARRAEATLEAFRGGGGGLTGGQGTGFEIEIEGDERGEPGDGAAGDLRARLFEAYGDPDVETSVIGGGTPPMVDLRGADMDWGRGLYEGAGLASDWLIVDSWYTIGPFPNPDRTNIDTAFPPEREVDLDARYPGKHGPVGWTFVQTGGVRVVPVDPEPYAVYYATTELWVDHPVDCWIAVGSDDQGTLWLNGERVWTSASHLKGWNPGEAYRRVHLRAGRNTVLFRIENGHINVAFSLLLRVRE